MKKIRVRRQSAIRRSPRGQVHIRRPNEQRTYCGMHEDAARWYYVDDLETTDPIKQCGGCDVGFRMAAAKAAP